MSSDVARITQKQTASLTYTVDCANRLTTAYPGQTITIASATGAVTAPAVISSASGTGTNLTFHLAVAAVTPPTDVEVVMTATLSNGDVDPISIPVGVVTT